MALDPGTRVLPRSPGQADPRTRPGVPRDSHVGDQVPTALSVWDAAAACRHGRVAARRAVGDNRRVTAAVKPPDEKNRLAQLLAGPHVTLRGAIAPLLAALLLGACASTPPAPAVPSTGETQRPASAIPSGGPSPTASESADRWLRVASVEQPPGFMRPTTDASGNTWTRGCAPCHPAVDTLMTGVVAGPAGVVAVGWIYQGFRGAAWLSRDGSDWTMEGAFPEESLLTAIAVNGSRYVAVGRDGQGATAWSSTDGKRWDRTAPGAAFGQVPLRLTSVAPYRGGFVAGGFAGNEFFSADAAFWLSPDGLTWRRAPDVVGMHGARVWSVATGGPGLVAVGEAGPADHPGPAAVWTSEDGLRWTRVADDPVFQGARMRSVADVPGIGLVAVGETVDGSIGVAWTSRDGIQWQRAPDTPVFGRPGIQLRMYAVTAGPHGAVAAGTVTEGTQYGESAIWTSPDGRAWTRLPSGPEFLDNEITGIAPWGSRLVAVGDRGAPDAYMATVWLSPEGVGR